MPYPEIDPILINLGPLPIRWYALAYIAGLVIGAWYVGRLVARPALWTPAAPPLGRQGVDDLVTWIIVGVILGGRLGFVLFYRPELIFELTSLGPLPVPQLIAIWEGGMSFHGGLLGVAVAALLFARRRETDPLRVGDLLACAAPIGLFFGRLANFINAELYGRETDAPVGMVFPVRFDREADAWLYGPEGSVGAYTREAWLETGRAVARHPSQLYEAALEGLVLFVVIRVAVTRLGALRHPGFATGLFLCGYGLARFVVEFFRQPDAYDFAGPIGFLTRGMMLSLPMIALGVFLAWRATRVPKEVPA